MSKAWNFSESDVGGLEVKKVVQDAKDSKPKIDAIPEKEEEWKPAA